MEQHLTPEDAARLERIRGTWHYEQVIHADDVPFLLDLIRRLTDGDQVDSGRRQHG